MNPRLKAMANQCKRVNQDGNCFCEFGCKALSYANSEYQRIKSSLESEHSLLKNLTSKNATLKEDWKMPSPPSEDYYLAVYNEGSEWIIHWASFDDENDIIEIDDWPFNEDCAKISDWQNLGIVVVY